MKERIKREIKKNKVVYFFLFLFLVLILLFHKSFFAYFSQDDFYHFKLGQADSLVSFINFFSPGSLASTGLYRPLSVQVYSFFGQRAFGLNYTLYHLFNFAVYFLTVLVVFKVFSLIFKDEKRAYFATGIYSLAAFHFTTMSFLWGIEELMASLFFFLSIFSYLKRKKISLVFFVLALLSRETAVTLPFVLLFLEWVREKKFQRTLPYFILLVLYFLFRLYFHLVPDESIYGLSFSPKLAINNYLWYFLWGLNFPENLIDFVSLPRIDATFFKIFHPYNYMIVVLGAALLIFLTYKIIRIVFAFFKEGLAQKTSMRDQIVFFTVFFLVTLAPFVFLDNHRFAFYLEIPFFGLSGLVAAVLSGKKEKLLFLCLFLITSFLTISFYNRFYWGITRAKVSQKILFDLKKTYPALPGGSTLYFTNEKGYVSPSKEWGGTSSQAKIAISSCNGPQFLYNDNSLKCLFEDDSPGLTGDEFLLEAKIN